MLKILKLAYYRNYWTYSNQILHSDRDYQNTLRGWSKQAYNKSKMADGRHLEKLYTVISPQRFDRSAQNLAWWRILAPRRLRAVKITNFWKSKMTYGRHLEKTKRPYLCNALTDLHKIWHGDAFWPSEGCEQLKLRTFENPRWFLKNWTDIWSYISVIKQQI